MSFRHLLPESRLKNLAVILARLPCKKIFFFCVSAFCITFARICNMWVLFALAPERVYVVSGSGANIDIKGVY
jgi:hypothetical protein